MKVERVEVGCFLLIIHPHHCIVCIHQYDDHHYQNHYHHHHHDHQVKDVRVPAQLMRAMAAEAEAAREARAKVTNIVIMKNSVMLTMGVLMHM